MYLAAVSMLCLLSSHQGCRGSQPAASSVVCGFPVRLPKQLNTLAPAQDMSHCQPLLVTYILHTHSTHNQHIYHTPCAESTHLISATCCMHLPSHHTLTHTACTWHTRQEYLPCIPYVCVPRFPHLYTPYTRWVSVTPHTEVTMQHLKPQVNPRCEVQGRRHLLFCLPLIYLRSKGINGDDETNQTS